MACPGVMSVEYDSLLSLLVDFRSSCEERHLQGGRTSKCVPVRVRNKLSTLHRVCRLLQSGVFVYSRPASRCDGRKLSLGTNATFRRIGSVPRSAGVRRSEEQ